MLSYIRGFIVLFVLLALLLYLPPGKEYQKYIRFFAQLLLVLSILSPFLSIICGDEEFMDKIAYEEFMENLDELSRDTQKIEYMQNDYYREQYEFAAAQDVKQIAGQELSEYGLCAQDVAVRMGEDYTIEEISVQIKKRDADDITVGEILISGDEEGKGEEDEAVYAVLRQKLARYYQMEESKIKIQYVNA